MTDAVIDALQRSVGLIEKYAAVVLKENESNKDLESYKLYFQRCIEYCEASNKVFEDSRAELKLKTIKNVPINEANVMANYTKKVEKLKTDLIHLGMDFNEKIIQNDSGGDVYDNLTVSQEKSTTNPVSDAKCGHKNPETSPVVKCKTDSNVKESDLVPNVSVHQKKKKKKKTSKKKIGQSSEISLQKSTHDN